MLIRQLRDITCHMWSHSVTCHPTQHKWTLPTLNPASKLDTRFTYPGGMEGWVDLGYPAMQWWKVEPSIFRSLVRRTNHYTTEPPHSAPSRKCNLRSAQVHGAHQAASHIPALNLPSRSRYSFTDPKRMEGWVSQDPGCKEQLVHGCYATTRGQLDSNPRPHSHW